MKKKFIILILFTIFTSLIQYGCDLATLGNDNVGTGHIKGIVYDADTKLRLSDVEISTSLLAEPIKSDDNGNYYILNINMGTSTQDISVTANKTDYQTAIISASLKAEDTVVVNIPMIHK